MFVLEVVGGGGSIVAREDGVLDEKESEPREGREGRGRRRRGSGREASGGEKGTITQA